MSSTEDLNEKESGVGSLEQSEWSGVLRSRSDVLRDVLTVGG